MCASFNWISADNSAYKVIYAPADDFFCLMPLFLRCAAAMKFKCNPWVAMDVAAGICNMKVVRKLGKHYYYVYSSLQGHELCYGVSDAPDAAPVFGGVLVSNGDMGLPGRETPDKAVNYMGNNHNGLEKIGKTVYIFITGTPTACSVFAPRIQCEARRHLPPEGRKPFLRSSRTETACPVEPTSLNGVTIELA